MNKKEQAAYDALAEANDKLEAKAKTQQLLDRALSWTRPIEPDVPIPQHNGFSTGYLFNPHAMSVVAASSGAVSHKYGSHNFREGGRTQGARKLYSTQLLALRALRHEMELDFAKKLAVIDQQIEIELQS